MEIKQVVDSFNSTGTISQDFIKDIEHNHSLRSELLGYFRQNKNRDFVISLLSELSTRRKNREDVSGDTLMLACYILGLHGQIEDCTTIWETKQIDFDTHCYIDAQLIVFGGVGKTIAFLENQSSDETRQILNYVKNNIDSGFFDDLESYFSIKPWYV